MLFVEHKTRRVAGKAILRLNHVAIADLATQAHIAIELQLAVGKGVDILLLGQNALDNNRVALLFLLLLERLEQGRGLLPARTSGIGDTHQFLLAIAQRTLYDSILLRARREQGIELLKGARRKRHWRLWR